MKKLTFPLHVSEQGVSAKVRKIAQNKNGKAYVFYVAEYFLLGKRKQEWFTEPDAAKSAASDACIRIATGEQNVLELCNQDRLVYLRAVEVLQASRVPLDTAASEFSQAVALLDGKATILEAVRDYVARRSVTLPKITVADAVQAMLKQLAADGKTQERCRRLRSHLNRLAEAFNVEVDTLTPKLISDYLTAMPAKERTKRNHRDTIGYFSRWLVLRSYLQKGTDLLEGVQNYSLRKVGEITTFTPDEMRLLLENASKRLLPVLLLGGFAGLRHAEITRLDWADIDLQEGFIEIAAHKSKTDTRRVVPIKDNLKAWLLPLAQRTGPVVDLRNSPMGLIRLGAKAGIEWKHNALRHTYISARVAECADIPRIADEAGNSPQIIRTNYLKRMRPAFAAAWFNIMPGISPAIPLPGAEKLGNAFHLSNREPFAVGQICARVIG